MTNRRTGRARIRLSLARATARLSRRSLRVFTALASHAGEGPAGLGAAAAARAARVALGRVPAYAGLVASAGGATWHRDPRAFLAGLPVTDKHSYIDRYPVADRCLEGRVPDVGVDFDESAGSSGTPYLWVRSAAELAEVHESLALLARYLLGDDGRPVVTINAFSMGAWATGVNVSRALTRIGAVYSPGPDLDRVLRLLRTVGPDATYVVTGYPPFLRSLLEAATEDGLDLAPYRLVGFVGGEGMTEGLRDRLESRFERVWSAYGASDLDIGVAAETPFSVWLRKACHAHPELAAELFGTPGRVPMLFQYDPLSYYVETVNGELVVTVCRDALLSPRIRYNVHDAGCTLSWDTVVAACRRHGLDPVRGARERLDVPLLRLPVLAVHGRSDSTVSFLGANIYPEDVAQGLAECPDAGSLDSFCLELVEQPDLSVRPCIHVEVVGPVAAGCAERVVETVRQRLVLNSADYRAAVAEDPTAADLRVRLHERGSGPFATDACRIKRRYVLPTVAGATLARAS